MRAEQIWKNEAQAPQAMLLICFGQPNNLILCKST